MTTEIQALYESQFDAIRAKDLDRLMSFYSPDIVYYDVVPPLRFVGSDALRERFTHWFAGFQGPIGMDLRDLHVAASGDLAIAHFLSRSRGTLTNGREVGSWVRGTSCCQRADGRWLVTHEHISLPVDVAAGRPATDLTP
jgi:uncharacterized protein (TIGR02246 family)